MGKDSLIIQFKTLEAVPKTLCMKHIGPYERFYESFSEAFKYMKENGMKIAGDPRTCYIDGIWNQEDPENGYQSFKYLLNNNGPKSGGIETLIPQRFSVARG